MADLSGGERRRLQLMRLLMGEPNVLLLDEPTNDLDIDTLTALEDLLDGWPGSLVVVSHDRYFVERVCTDVYGLPGDGRIVHLPGGIEQYVEQRRAEQEAAARRRRAGPPRGRPAGPRQRAAAGAQGRRPAGARARPPERPRGRAARALAANATDYARVAELDAELQALRRQRAATEEAWLEAASLLEAG